MTRILWQSVRAFLIMVSGLAFHYGMLRLTDSTVTVFPSLPDPILAVLPTVKIDVLGEIAFVTIVVAFAIYYFTVHPRRTPELMIAIGLLYAVRGVFLWLMPIGSPPGAPTDVLQVYPFPSHSYFPGGHVGLISLFGFMIHDRRWRIGFLVAAGVFGFGTMLAKAHYTGDTLAGFLLAWAVATAVQKWHRQSARTVLE